MNEIISFELNERNKCRLINLANMLYASRVEELGLPTIMCDYFAKYVKDEKPKSIFSAIMSYDDSWLRDIVTYGIIDDLTKGVENVKSFKRIIENNCDEFWSVIYDFFGLDADEDTFTEYDILARFGHDIKVLEKELTTPCNQLVSYIFEVYSNAITK